ncbi:phasin family protein [Paraburkholderia aromaticivorans]|uniref:phasin family protein n=1 Tax=Paraburkholderia aromaticivorans TaxID=2026199 RepID=UPI0014560AE1|nr:phasin family protein [Paraburkholderia aromaticivorans]
MNATTLKYRPLRPGSAGTLKVYDWMLGAAAELEKVASLNSLTVRTSPHEQRFSAEASLYAQSVREAIALQSNQLHATLIKTFTYCRHIEEIAAESGDFFATVMLVNVQSFVTTMRALIGAQPAEKERATSEPVRPSLPTYAARREIVTAPESTAFFAERVPRGRMH